MGRSIVEQPDGKYAVWSSVVDHFILVNATQQEVIDFYVTEFRLRLEDSETGIFGTLRVSTRFDETWETGLGTIGKVHGLDEVKRFLQCAKLFFGDESHGS